MLLTSYAINCSLRFFKILLCNIVFIGFFPLAGQFDVKVGNYLRYTFESYAKGQRKTGEKMEKKFKTMQEKAGAEGIEQLIHFYASQK